MRSFVLPAFLTIVTMCILMSFPGTCAQSSSNSRNLRLHSPRSSKKFVRLRSSGVDGKGKESDPDTKLTIESVGTSEGKIRKGVNRYLCVTTVGKFVVETKSNANNNNKCVFRLIHSGGLSYYESRYNSSWYFAINKSGNVKTGPNTNSGDKSAIFLEIPY